MQTTFTLPSPLGPITFFIENKTITYIDIFSTHQPQDADNDLEIDIAKQFDAYFSDPTHVFSLPVQLCGTEYQVKVWENLQDIPVGKTLTYGELAKQLKSSARAIGNACRKNPTPIVIPCHRIIAANGIGGFSGETQGETINKKRYLLEHEDTRIPIQSNS